MAALVLQLLYGLVSDGVTDDEPIYVASGLMHARGDFRVNRDQPPLAKLLAALPLLPMQPRVPEPPDADSEAWSYRVIHTENRHRPLVPVARLPAVVASTLLGLVVWSWGRAAAGPRAALVALAVVAFQPALLAHGHLATTDAIAALMMVASSAAFWLFLESASAGRALLVSVGLGLAVTTRLTAWLLVPVFLVLLAAAALRPAGRPRAGRAVLLLAATMLLTVPLVIWGVYAFRFEPWPGAAPEFSARPSGATGELLRFSARHRLLPHAYLEGFRFQLEHSAKGHPAYLLGGRSETGFPHYYLVALLVKNTPGFLALAALAAWLARARPGPSSAARAHWLITAAAIVLAASAGGIHIGERYILAAYPYLALWIASFMGAAWDSKRVRRAAGVALAAHAVPVLLAAPAGHLAYFNLIAGGSRGGHRWLADSNLDWGQDLPRLADWMRQNGVRRVRLGYFGSDDPSRYGIAYDPAAGGVPVAPPAPPRGPQGEVLILSPNVVLGFLAPSGEDAYASFRGRAPDDRAGIFFVYRLR
jgi:hypothetical protein